MPQEKRHSPFLWWPSNPPFHTGKCKLRDCFNHLVQIILPSGFPPLEAVQNKQITHQHGWAKTSGRFCTWKTWGYGKHKLQSKVSHLACYTCFQNLQMKIHPKTSGWRIGPRLPLCPRSVAMISGGRELWFPFIIT